MKRSTLFLFRAAGPLACAVAVLPGFVGLWFAGPEHAAEGIRALTGRADVAFVAVFLLRLLGAAAFAAAFWLSTRPGGHPVRRGLSLLLGQLLLALVVEVDLLYILAAELPFVLPWRGALAWLAVQGAGLATASAYAATHLHFALIASLDQTPVPPESVPLPPPIAVFVTGVVTAIAWQAFAFCMGYIAAAERQSRIELVGAHAELVAMQQLLGDSTRAAERLRIARELHDGLGHHLVALGLHLELAARQAPTTVADSIRTSRDIAQQLMAEVRTAVGSQRAEQPIDLRRALDTLCSGIPAPRVVLSFDECIEISDPSLAHVIFRCVQEAVSNAIRHAAASAVEVAVVKAGEGGLVVLVNDDGHGAGTIIPGNGLRGMRERVEALGGSVDIRPREPRGLSVRIRLPVQGTAP